MRIAVASDNGHDISAHFGRCSQFIIFEVENGAAKRVEDRSNAFSAHARGNCESGHGQGESGHHSHQDLVAALQDCQAVICHGMGRRAVADLITAGIKPVFAGQDISAQEAAGLYARGELNEQNGSACNSH